MCVGVDDGKLRIDRTRHINIVHPMFHGDSSMRSLVLPSIVSILATPAIAEVDPERQSHPQAAQRHPDRRGRTEPVSAGRVPRHTRS